MTRSPRPLIESGSEPVVAPLVLNPMVTRLAESAGCSAIKIEDQILAKRAHHHIGIEHIIPPDLMVAKVEEAVAARRSREFLIIARTNAARQPNGLDDALRRGEAMRKAGADLLVILPGKPEEVKVIGESLPGLKMFMMSGTRLSASGMTKEQLAAMGDRLFVDPTTPLMVVHRALRDYYAAMRPGLPDPLIGTDTRAEQEHGHTTIGLESLLAIERRTVER